MEKQIVKETVRELLRESLEPKDAFVELVAESKDAFNGMNANIVLENAAVNPRLVKDIDKTKTMYLENGDHRIMVFTNNKVHEVLDLATDERIVLGSRGEVMQYVNEKKAEGFKPVRNKSAIAKFLRKSVRKIANYVRKYGLITLVGVGVAAALIYFVGPMAVPFLSQIAMRLGLGGLIGGGESVEVAGDWVNPAPNLAGEMGGADYTDPMGGATGYDGSSPVDAYRSANSVGIQGDLNADPFGGVTGAGFDASQLNNMNSQIGSLNNDIDGIVNAMSGDIDPATRNALASELQSAINQRDYLQGAIASGDQAAAAAANSASSLAATAAAQVSAQVAQINQEISRIAQAMSGNIAPETRNVLAAELQRLTQQRNSLR